MSQSQKSSISINNRILLSANTNRNTMEYDFYNDRSEYAKHLKIEGKNNMKIIVLDCVNLYRQSTSGMCKDENYRKYVSITHNEEFQNSQYFKLNITTITTPGQVV